MKDFRVSSSLIKEFLRSYAEIFTDIEERLHGGKCFFVFNVVDVIIATSERPFFLVRDDLLVYANPAAVQLLDLGGGDVIGDKFLNLVDSGDWKVLVENIGEMIAGDKALQIRMRGSTGKVVPIDFKAIYLPEIEHFSFILTYKALLKTGFKSIVK